MPRRAFIPICAIVLAAPITWMLMDREPPYTRVAGHVTPALSHPGDWISIVWEIDVHRRCTPIAERNITRRIIESTGRYYNYEPVGSDYNGSSPRAKIVIRPFKLPRSIEPGETRYHSLACYHCNPLQRLLPVCVSTPDITFTVEKE